MSDTPANECGREAARTGHAAQDHHHRGKSSENLLDRSAVLDALKILPGQIIVDAGCGNGYMSKAFSAAMGDTGIVYALDPDEEALVVLRNETEGRNIQVIMGDVTVATPLPAASVDLVYIANVLHGFTPAQLRGFCNEIVRILKPHGRLAVVEIDKRDTPFGPPLALRFSPDDLRQCIPLVPSTLSRAGEYLYMQTFENSR